MRGRLASGMQIVGYLLVLLIACGSGLACIGRPDRDIVFWSLTGVVVILMLRRLVVQSVLHDVLHVVQDMSYTSTSSRQIQSRFSNVARLAFAARQGGAFDETSTG